MSGARLELPAAGALSVVHVELRDGLSELFAARIVATLEDATLELDDVVDAPAVLHLEPDGHAVGEAAYPGIVTRAELSRIEPNGRSTYTFDLAPALERLTRRSDHRSFRHLTTIEIVREVLSRWGIEPTFDVDDRRYLPLPYKVQYGETDHDFLLRILEEAGLVWITGAGAPPGGVLFSDGLERRRPLDEPIDHVDVPAARTEAAYVTSIARARAVAPGAVVVREFDLRRPASDVTGGALTAGGDPRLEQHFYTPGAFARDVALADTSTPTADSRGATRADEAAGALVADARLAAARGDAHRFTLRTNLLHLRAGDVFAVRGHPELADGTALLATAISLRHGGGGEAALALDVDAVPAEVPFRTARGKPVPKARLQPAFVLSLPDDPIDVDELGRVRLRFPWDRDEENEEGCLRVRVSQTWAGAGFGWVMHPRAGEEVLVDFIDGDPEQPFVVGRLFNRIEPPPYPLPRDATRSGWRSASAPVAGGFNEIALEDKKGDELFYVQAERDRRALVGDGDVETTVGDRQKGVDGGELETTLGDRWQTTMRDRIETTEVIRQRADLAERRDRVFGELVEDVRGEERATILGSDNRTSGGDRLEKDEQDEHLTCGGGREVAVAAADELAVSGLFSESLGGYFVTAKKYIHYVANEMVIVETPVDQTWKASGNFVRVDPSGVYIQGATVWINDQGAPADLKMAGAGPARPPHDAKVAPPPPPKLDLDAAVKIRDESGFASPCPLVPNQKSHRYKAIGTPGGGTFRWKVTGKASSKGSLTNAVVEVHGDALSDRVDDSELEVEYTVRGKTAKASLALTVFELTGIEASQRATPPRNRPKQKAPAPQKIVSQATKGKSDKSGPTVIRGSVQVDLRAQVKPAGVAALWEVVRASDDPTSGDAPTLTQGAEPAEAILGTAATGCFEITTRVDCTAKLADRTRVLDLNFVEVRCTAIRHGQELPGKSWPVDYIAGVHLIVDDAKKKAGSIYSIVGSFEVVGGGKDKDFGIANVHCGFAQSVYGTTLKASYQAPAGGSNVASSVYADTANDPNAKMKEAVIVGGTVEALAFPVRDLEAADDDSIFKALQAANGRKSFDVAFSDAPNCVLHLSVSANGGAGAARALVRFGGADGFVTYACAAAAPAQKWSEDVGSGTNNAFSLNYTVVGESVWNVTYGAYDATQANGWNAAGPPPAAVTIVREQTLAATPAETVAFFQTGGPDANTSATWDARQIQ